MSNVAISFENVSKIYRGAHEYRALRDDVVGVAGRLVGRKRPPRAVVRSLDDVSFEVAEGESFAIIGFNGAGKTTALKLATRITYPSAGRVRVRGRVGALLEVGTGMHPELSGRENIRLYGRILGLSGRQIAERFEQIVEFAGIGRAIDQPVKQYSSGMTLRLGFSVAAHLDPDVLLVDEAIAVGDAGFQYRCVERMAQLVREGRTLVFVSHDMNAVETLCTRALLVQDGRIAADGSAREVVASYLSSVEDERAHDQPTGFGGGPLRLDEVSLHDDEGGAVQVFESGAPMTVRVRYHAQERLSSPAFSFGISDGRVGTLAVASMLIDGETPAGIAGPGTIECRFEELSLRPRAYELWGSVRGEAGYGDLVDWQLLRRFRVVARNGDTETSRVAMPKAPVLLPYAWKVEDAS